MVALLEVEDLSVQVGGQTLLANVSFSLLAGQVLCIVGESGAGKSTLLKGLQGLLPATCGSFRFAPAAPSDESPGEGRVLDQLPKAPELGLPMTRWVMQDPLAALNPKLSLGRSIGESLHRRPYSKDLVRQRVLSALADVELPAEFYDRRPGQVSLGQAQRACLARAMVAEPKLVLFDEPLSALDAVVQKKIAYRMDILRKRSDISYIIVTHDMGFAEAYADQVMVLNKGKVADYQPADAFFTAPADRYAEDLLASARALGSLRMRVGGDDHES